MNIVRDEHLGFEPEWVRSGPRVSSFGLPRALNMKGRRLDPLATEEVKLVLKPKVQGQFVLKPRILYVDESGKYKSHDPEPIEVTVKELGISGWLKGRQRTVFRALSPSLAFSAGRNNIR